jgi:peptidyl-prolyl cis-trans isomerase SurA
MKAERVGSMMRNGFAGFLAAAVSGLAAATAQGPQTMGDAVAATVNDQPISTFDVQQRVLLMMITSGGGIPEGAERQFQEQALRDLVEEELKRQEVEEFGIQVPDEEVIGELARIAASGGGSIDTLAADLQRSGIAIETLQEKIRVDNAWETLIRGRYRSRVNITEGEIDDMLSEMRAEQSAEQYLLSEICLPVSNEAERERIYNVGMQMLGQMQQGVPFQALAQQFSVCPSAARGGDLGWTRLPEVEEPVAEVLRQLGEGNVSTPIEVENGQVLKLVAMRAKREAAEKGDPSYELAYAAVPKGLYSRREAQERLSRLPVTNACNAEGLSTDLGEGIGVELIQMVPISAIREPYQDTLLDMKRGDISPLLESTEYYHMVYVCEMDEGLGLPRRRTVKNKLMGNQFQLLSRRYLRDVERDSDVDIRLFRDEPMQES